MDKDTKDTTESDRDTRKLKIARRRQQPRDRIIENRGREGTQGIIETIMYR